MKVTYYLITDWGRSKMNATTDDEAIAEKDIHAARYGYCRIYRIMKETKETIWE